MARTPVDGVHEAGRTSATTSDGTQMLVGDVGFDYIRAVQVWIDQQTAKPASHVL